MRLVCRAEVYGFRRQRGEDHQVGIEEAFHGDYLQRVELVAEYSPVIALAILRQFYMLILRQIDPPINIDAAMIARVT
jgi:hypothetical protein